MLKESFTLKKNGWYVKLMTYIWGFKHTDFSHMCPFWWLTIFNLIIIIPVFVTKVSWKVISWPIRALSDYNTNIDIKREEALIDRLRSTKAEFDFVLDLNDKLRNIAMEFLYDNNYKIYDVLNTILSERRRNNMKKQENKLRNKKKASMNRKERINKILGIIKPVISIIAYILGLVLLLGILYLIKLFIVYLINLPSDAWYNVGIVFAIVGGAVIIAFSLVFLLKIIIKPRTYNYNPTPNAFEKVGGFIAKPFVWIAKGIYTIFSILIEIIKNNCPAIDWKDK